MCGVVGFFGNFRRNEERIENIIRESSIRGVHSFGFSYLSNGILFTEKRHSVDEIIQVLKAKQPNQFIFHNRYSTTGDWKDHKNNQPIQVDNFSIVFNGVISQATREENEKEYQMELLTDNDGEILLKTEDRESFIKNHKGSFAGLLYDGEEFFCFRNARRPLWFKSDVEGILIASTEDIFKRSLILGAKPIESGKLIPVGCL